MKNISYITVTILVAGLAVNGCKKANPEGSVVPEKNSILTVDMQKPVQKDIAEILTYSGTVTGEEETAIRSKISETVVEVPVSVGQYVKKGTVLVKFDNTTGTTQYEQAKSNFELAQKTYDRNLNLFKVGGISQQMLDQAKTQLDVAASNYNGVKSMVQVEAPIDGTVTSINVNPGDFVTVGSAVAVVSNLSSLKTTIDLSAKDISKVKVGTQVKVSLVDYPNETATGRVYEVAKSADNSTRTFAAKIRLSKPGSVFKSGLFARVEISTSENKTGFVIPVSALYTSNSHPAVFVVKDSVAYVQQIEIGYRDNSNVAVISGITASDYVVTSGTLLLKNGDKINPKKLN